MDVFRTLKININLESVCLAMLTSIEGLEEPENGVTPDRQPSLKTLGFLRITIRLITAFKSHE
jgi:hypothetical protein